MWEDISEVIISFAHSLNDLIMRYFDLADPKSVHVRSLSCDLTWPTYSTISKEELDLPLAYVLTIFSDPRNIELTLATIFRPHNSYCLHVDPKSDDMFRSGLQPQ